MDLKGKIVYFLMLVIFVLLLAVSFLGYERARSLESRNKVLEQRIEDWIKIIDLLTTEQKRITQEIEQGRTKEREIRMNVGREIKDFNQRIKTLKKIEDPYESIDALDRAWGDD